MPVWDTPEFDHHEQICCFTDPRTQLKAIIAIHSTALGPAVGGTRFWPYAEDHLALEDALRLSRAMSYKCALAGVPFGGGKAVIIGDPKQLKRRELRYCRRDSSEMTSLACTSPCKGLATSAHDYVSSCTRPARA